MKSHNDNNHVYSAIKHPLIPSPPRSRKQEQRLKDCVESNYDFISAIRDMREKHKTSQDKPILKLVYTHWTI